MPSPVAGPVGGGEGSIMNKAFQEASDGGLSALEQLTGSSQAATVLRAAIRRFAPLDAPVLITGETGTGKDLVARAIHACSPRARLPFLAINCGAIAETLLESELFGHERGAFTGAHQTHRGIFEAAATGTVFLDEIGDIPPRLQVALLRVLESGEIRPVGSAASRKTACRLLAATNADLAERVDQGRFRNDLLYRLQRLQVHLQPLRERREDILPLAEHFLAEGQPADAPLVMDQALRDELRSLDWPGNVRELKNTIERIRLLHPDRTAFGIKDLNEECFGRTPSGRYRAVPPEVAATASASGSSERTGTVSEFLAQGTSPLRRLDRLREIFSTHGKLTRAEAARILGVSLPTATRDLQQLATEGLIERIEPTPSPRTHYFRLRG
jgi:DNA-binding NtrC family response regulator